MTKKKKIGICSICGREKELSFEHIPPMSSFNANPVMMKDHRHLTVLGRHLYGKRIRSNKGMGGWRTCEPCNNNTGSWYAEEYTNVVKQTIEQLESQDVIGILNLKLDFKPLNFLKQVIIHHLCADQALGQILDYVQETNFILNRDETNLKEDIRIFMYSTLSETHRIFGIMTMFSGAINGIVNYSEFSYKPFGFILSLGDDPPIKNMLEITDFKNYKFNEKVSQNISLPILPVKSLIIGHYP